MVVDDAESNRHLLKELLTKTGLDIKMPVLDSFETTRKLKTNPRNKEIPFITLSVSTTPEYRSKTMDEGFEYFNVKNLYLGSLEFY